MPYMEGSAGLGDVASNRQAYANIKGGGNPFMTATPERHQRAAVSSGPQGAIVQQDTATQTRRVVTSSTKPTTAFERRSAAALKALVAENHTWSGPKPSNEDHFVSGGLGPPIEAAPSSEVFTRDGVRRIPGGRQRVSMKPPEQALVYRRSNTSLLGEYGDLAEGPEYLGFSLGKIVKNIGNTVKKAVVDTGHVAGKVVTSTAGQAILGTALAVTGVGAPAAAAIFATTKGVGNLVKPGGNLKHAVTGAAQGAVEGVVAAGAGKVARAAISKISSSHASTGAAATAAAKAALPGSGSDAAMAAILAAGVPAGISMIPGAPQNDGLIPRVPQAAPIFPKQKRVAASDATRGGGSKVGAAKKVLDAGKTVNKKANQGANQIDALSAKLDSLGQAMQAAKEIGDKAGIDALSQAAAAVQAQLANAQNIAGGASGDLRAAGAAAEGAATGAVGGAGLSSLADFVDSHKPLVYGTAAALALAITAAMMHTPARSGGTRTVYRSRPRASRR